MSEQITSYVCKLSDVQSEHLLKILETKGWAISTIPHAKFKAKFDKVNVVAYNSGKCTVQGKGTANFILFILEPEILKVASFGYEDVIDKHDKEEAVDFVPFEPHAGIDESGKGDFFGPLVIAAAYVDEYDEKILLDLGVKDSKVIKSEKKIKNIASSIRRIIKGRYSIVTLGPEAYNKIYKKIGNLNKLLAWGHARVLENLLEMVPECNDALSDKFGHESLIKNALMERGKGIRLRQQTKAESDVAVAAASILARDEFVRKIDSLSESYGITLFKGASVKVIEAGRLFVEKHGREQLHLVGKMHFKTSLKVLGETVA